MEHVYIHKESEQAGDRQEAHTTQVCIEGIWWDITLIIRVRSGQLVFVTIAEIKRSP
jgi:hypothetical protein